MKANFLSRMMVFCSALFSLAAAQSPAPIPHPAPVSVEKPALLTPDQKVARNLVETVYNTWRLGVMRGDESTWRRTTTASRQMRVRNLIISERGNFPRDFFRSAHNTPQLEHFRFVGVLGGCGGKTLAATYIGKMQLGDDGTPHDNAFVLLLVHEGGRWKLDQTRFFDLTRLPDVLRRLQAQDLAVLREQDGFHPYSSIPAVPPACGAPQLVSKIFVDCPGRALNIRINGVSIHEFDDERRADTVSGGLRRGQNTITYTIRNSTNGQERPRMGIGLFVMPEAPGTQPVCVFDHILDAEGTAQGGTYTFNVTPELLAAMNPKNTGAAPQPFHVVPLKPKK